MLAITQDYQWLIDDAQPNWYCPWCT